MNAQKKKRMLLIQPTIYDQYNKLVKKNMLYFIGLTMPLLAAECGDDWDVEICIETIEDIPWDTDMSFGVYWNDGFRYIPESVETISYRMEYEKIRAQYPEIDQLLAERWKELRQSVYSEENIFNKVHEYTMKIHGSGAYTRDYNYLGWHSWGEEDTLENFETYITKRLQILDNYYGVR